MKIKERFISLIQSFKKAFKKFPVTMALVVFTTLFCSIFLNTSLFKEKIYINILEYFLLFTVGSLFIEVYGKSKFKNKIIEHGISAIISGVFIFIINMNLSSNNEFNLNRILISYIVILLTLIVYFFYKNSKKSIEEYSIKVFSNIVKTSFTYFVLSIGTGIITAIFIYLILGSSFGYELVSRLEILLFGIYFVPNIIYSFTNIRRRSNSIF